MKHLQENKFIKDFFIHKKINMINESKEKRKINKKNIEDFTNYLFLLYLNSFANGDESIKDLSSTDIMNFIKCKDFLTDELSGEFKSHYINTESNELKLKLLGLMLNDISFIYSHGGENLNFISIMKNIIEKMEKIAIE
jgi:hypothetical protein